MIKGIVRDIVEDLKQRTIELSQGRAAGCLGFVDAERYISTRAEIVDGGVTGLPLRRMLGTVANIAGLSLIEAVKRLPENVVYITTQPGRTGIITDIGVVDMLHMPMVNIGVKDMAICGVGISCPEQHFFNLATETEMIDLHTLQAQSIEEEKHIIRRSAQLSMQYLDVGREIAVVEKSNDLPIATSLSREQWVLPRMEIKSMDEKITKELVRKSLASGQGREVASIGLVDEEGHVRPRGQIVIGGMGMVPPRLLASSICNIKGKSLFEIWLEEIPHNAVIIHTHPGGSGVMHAGDASAGPCTWGRPIIAVGHDKTGHIQGATVIELNDTLIELGDRSEKLDLAFFSAATPEEEADIRNKMFGISQAYTNLCKSIEIR